MDLHADGAFGDRLPGIRFRCPYAAGRVAVVAVGRKRSLRAIVSKLRVEIDPYSNRDTLEVA
jgi:hypothetical protein